MSLLKDDLICSLDELPPVFEGPRYPTKYERAAAIACRALLIAQGARSALPESQLQGLNSIQIARLEWKARNMGKMVVRRYKSNGEPEDIEVNEFLRTIEDDESDDEPCR